MADFELKFNKDAMLNISSKFNGIAYNVQCLMDKKRNLRNNSYFEKFSDKSNFETYLNNIGNCLELSKKIIDNCKYYCDTSVQVFEQTIGFITQYNPYTFKEVREREKAEAEAKAILALGSDTFNFCVDFAEGNYGKAFLDLNDMWKDGVDIACNYPGGENVFIYEDDEIGVIEGNAKFWSGGFTTDENAQRVGDTVERGIEVYSIASSFKDGKEAFEKLNDPFFNYSSDFAIIKDCKAVIDSVSTKAGIAEKVADQLFVEDSAYDILINDIKE